MEDYKINPLKIDEQTIALTIDVPFTIDQKWQIICSALLTIQRHNTISKAIGTNLFDIKDLNEGFLLYSLVSCLQTLGIKGLDYTLIQTETMRDYQKDVFNYVNEHYPGLKD